MDSGNTAKWQSIFDIRAEIAFLIELRALTVDMVDLLIKRRQANIDTIGDYSDEERAELTDDTQIVHRAMFLMLQRTVDMEVDFNETIKDCNSKIDDLYKQLNSINIGPLGSREEF